MPTVTLANGRQFAAEPGTPLLDAALAQDIVLEHSCRTGRCGSCKARVLGGSAAPVRDASCLSPGESERGWILTCAYEATSDLTLDVEDLGTLAGITAKTHPARIAALEPMSSDVMRIELRLPPNARFRFVPGQSIDVTGPGGIRRSYSLASDASAPDRLELQVRQVASGQLSAYWFGQARVNDLLRFHGPRGSFFLRPAAGEHVVLLATGTGIAPFRSMLLQLAALPSTERPASVSLYWGGRHAEDLYFDPRPLLPELHYVPVQSRAGEGWAGACGHVQTVCLADAVAAARPWSHAMVYACGSERMIQDARSLLLAAGLPAKRFFYDAFVRSD